MPACDGLAMYGWTITHELSAREDGWTIMYTNNPAKNNDDAPVPLSWLNENGQQILLIDMQHKRAISLTCSLKRPSNWHNHVPASLLDSAYAYCRGDGGMPVGAPIEIRRPMTYTKELIDYTNNLVDACSTWKEMRYIEDASAFNAEIRDAVRSMNSYPDIGRLTRSKAASKTFDKLTLIERMQLLKKGYKLETQGTFYENLYIA